MNHVCNNLFSSIMFLSLRTLVSISILLGLGYLVVQGQTGLIDDTWATLSHATALFNNDVAQVG